MLQRYIRALADHICNHNMPGLFLVLLLGIILPAVSLRNNNNNQRRRGAAIAGLSSVFVQKLDRVVSPPPKSIVYQYLSEDRDLTFLTSFSTGSKSLSP